jgi:hypothetical protein
VLDRVPFNGLGFGFLLKLEPDLNQFATHNFREKSGKKQPTPSSSSGNQLSAHVKKFFPSGPETGQKLHQTYCFFAQSRAR